MHGPAGVPSSARVQRRDSLNNPLVGFSSPSRPVSSPLPPAFLPAAPLMGFSCPYNASGGESPRLSKHRLFFRRPMPGPASLVLPGWSADGSHSADYGAARRFSQPLSGFFLSPTSRHFQTGCVHGVYPTGGCSSNEASTTPRRRHTLVTFLPQTALPPS